MHEPARTPENMLAVSREEAGMKLLRFLERRLPGPPPQGMLHKWIRTGQVRVNGGRAKAFSLLRADDLVRVPPFAPVSEAGYAPAEGPEPIQLLASLGVPVVAATEALLVMNKPAGLAVQDGSGQRDSVAGRMTEAWRGRVYSPAPAHRLDRHTSGLLLAGLRHSAQQALHRAFAEQGVILKEYLTWVSGLWPEERPCLLADSLYKEHGLRDAAGKSDEKMRARPGGRCRVLEPDTPFAAILERDAGLDGGEPEGLALAAVLLIRHMNGQDLMRAEISPRSTPGRDAAHPLPGKNSSSPRPSGTASLMLVRLLTGRTHQIRVQFASRGFPVIGDGRYGGPGFRQMLLHAWRISLPQDLLTDSPPASSPLLTFDAPPPWPALLIPTKSELSKAQTTLEQALW